MSKPTLGHKLFMEIEDAQGYAHISDSIELKSGKDAIVEAKRSLKWTLEVARRLKGFIKEHGKEKPSNLQSARSRKNKAV